MALKRATDTTKPPASLVKVLHALADPVRLEIVRQLDAEGEKPCGSFGIDMPKSSMSHHFSTLRGAGVLSFEKRGVEVFNRVERDALESHYPGLLDSVLSAAGRDASKSKRPAFTEK